MPTIPIVELALSDGSSTPFGTNSIREKVYPKTHYLAVEGLLENSKIALSLMHPAVLGANKFAGTISTGKTLQNLLDIIASFAGAPELYQGCFITTNANVTISASSGHIIENGDENEANVTTTNLNKNDSIVLKKYLPGQWDKIATLVPIVTIVPTGVASEGDRRVMKIDADTGVLYEYDTSWHSVGNIQWIEDIHAFQSTTALLPATAENNAYCLVRNYNPMPAPGAFEDHGELYQFDTTDNTVIWSVINNNNDEAVGASTVGASKPGLMSADMASKLYNIQAGALNNPHPENGANVTLTLGGIEKIATVTVNNLGHVTAITKEDIQDATTSQKGVIQLATLDEHATGTNTSKGATVAGVREMQKMFGDAKYYADLSAANAHVQGSPHPAGVLALIKVSEVYV